MKNTIEAELLNIEDSNGVKVLYACEAGSRCWGIESKDSDYDVRFIYRHKWNWYLKLNKGRDVIERISGNLDISGWDVRKALWLFKKSNPPLLEWLRSPTVYWSEWNFVHELAALVPQYYNPTAACYHYFHMARGNYRNYLAAYEVPRKKYLYVLRPLLCVKYIEETGNLPPIHFWGLVMAGEFEPPLSNAILDLLSAKKAGKEMGLGARIPIIHGFIVEELDRMENEKFSGKPELKGWDLLNDLFIETVFKEPFLQQIDSLL